MYADGWATITGASTGVCYASALSDVMVCTHVACIQEPVKYAAENNAAHTVLGEEKDLYYKQAVSNEEKDLYYTQAVSNEEKDLYYKQAVSNEEKDLCYKQAVSNDVEYSEIPDSSTAAAYDNHEHAATLADTGTGAATSYTATATGVPPAAEYREVPDTDTTYAEVGLPALPVLTVLVPSVLPVRSLDCFRFWLST